MGHHVLNTFFTSKAELPVMNGNTEQITYRCSISFMHNMAYTLEPDPLYERFITYQRFMDIGQYITDVLTFLLHIYSVASHFKKVIF